MPHHISEIYPCNGVPQRLLVLSPTGDLTVVDADLGIRGTVPPPPSSVTLLQSFVFSRESSPFLLGPPGSTVLVLVEHSQDATTNIRILDVSVGEGRDIGNTKIPVKSDVRSILYYSSMSVDRQAQQIASVSCSSSGYLSIMSEHALS